MNALTGDWLKMHHSFGLIAGILKTHEMRVHLLGIPVDAITMKETLERVDRAVIEGQHINHVVINAGKVVMMKKDPQLFNSVVSCDIINADGQSIVWAARCLGKKIPERVAGADLMEEIMRLAGERRYKCFFLGAREEVVKKVADIYADLYGNEIIAGYRNGYFKVEEEMDIAKQIAVNGTQILFVAITSPKKENFLFKYRDILKDVNFTMGVGGTFDVVAGVTKRAPRWMQNNGLEWFYRFLQEPRRMWKRYLFGNAEFIYLVLKEKLHGA